MYGIYLNVDGQFQIQDAQLAEVSLVVSCSVSRC